MMGFDTIMTGGLICPYCDHEQEDAWGYTFSAVLKDGHEHEIDCQKLDCGKEFIVFIVIVDQQILYSTRKLKKGKTHVDG